MRQRQPRHAGSHHGNQPVYHDRLPKIEARQFVIKAYRWFTKRRSIPSDRNYWTLCNNQPDAEGTEIVQMLRAGLLKRSQFYGVDRDIDGAGIIEKNRLAHPQAHWFKGEWLDIIDEHYDEFRPALVYFDSTQTPQTIYPDLTATMNLCPAGTVLVATIIMMNPRNGDAFNPDDVMPTHNPYLHEPEAWVRLPWCYEYRCSFTPMATFAFRRN